MKEYIKPGATVYINKVCSKTMERHGLVHSKKKMMLGREYTIDRIRDEETIVINRWHFHPDDLYPPGYGSIPKLNFEDKEVVKKEYIPIHFKIENIL